MPEARARWRALAATTWPWMDRASTFTQMGGEGVPWVGQAPFTNEKHIFANLGDGFPTTPACWRSVSIAAKVNITYKILYNDAVAMTGGQPHDGPLSPLSIINQVRAEGRAEDRRGDGRAGKV